MMDNGSSTASTETFTENGRDFSARDFIVDGN